jgi:hypothetical protein
MNDIRHIFLHQFADCDPGYLVKMAETIDCTGRYLLDGLPPQYWNIGRLTFQTHDGRTWRTFIPYAILWQRAFDHFIASLSLRMTASNATADAILHHGKSAALAELSRITADDLFAEYLHNPIRQDAAPRYLYVLLEYLQENVNMEAYRGIRQEEIIDRLTFRSPDGTVGRFYTLMFDIFS